LSIFIFHRLISSITVSVGQVVDVAVHVISIANVERVPVAEHTHCKEFIILVNTASVYLEPGLGISEVFRLLVPTRSALVCGV
jgi:hypothetical protein